MKRVAWGHVIAIDGFGDFDRLAIDIDQADQPVGRGQFVRIASKNPPKTMDE
jgi:hypothetical protein